MIIFAYSGHHNTDTSGFVLLILSLFWTEGNSKSKFIKMPIMMVTLGRRVFLPVFWLDVARRMKDLVGVVSQICLILTNVRLGINWEKNHKHPLKSFYS